MQKLKEDDKNGAGPPESETQLIALRQNLRMEIILSMGELNYTLASSLCKDLLGISRKLFAAKKSTYFFSYVTDSCLLAKLFMRQYKMQLAQEIMLQSLKILSTFLNEKNYKIRIDTIRGPDQLLIKNLQTQLQESLTTQSPATQTLLTEKFELQTSLLMLAELKRRTTL